MLGNNSYIVLGEASESDEDEFNEQNLSARLAGSSSGVVAGEASESEDELHEECNYTEKAFKAKAESARYNSLLHKKLRESNYKLKEDLKKLVASSLKYTTDQVNEINQRLLSNQIEIQDTIKHLRKSTKSITKTENIMSYILSQNFVPSINIDV